MTTKQKCVAQVAALNAEIDDWETSVTLDAPSGFKWVVSGTHYITYYYDYSKSEVWRGMWQDLKEGLTACKEQPCEVCPTM